MAEELNLELVAGARRSLVPPARLALSEWAEEHVRLPEGATALPGPLAAVPLPARGLPTRSATRPSSG